MGRHIVAPTIRSRESEVTPGARRSISAVCSASSQPRWSAVDCFLVAIKRESHKRPKKCRAQQWQQMKEWFESNSVARDSFCAWINEYFIMPWDQKANRKPT